MITVLVDDAPRQIEARPDGESLWIDGAQFASLTGYELKPEGACRDDVCVPLNDQLVRDGHVDVAGFCRLMERPVLHDESGSVWLLAEAGSTRRRALASGRAPDFRLPDLEGTQHSLSEFRGKKVFLATWASW